MKITAFLACILCISVCFASELRRKRQLIEYLGRDSRESRESPESHELGGILDLSLLRPTPRPSTLPPPVRRSHPGHLFPFDTDDYVNFVVDFGQSGSQLGGSAPSALCGSAGQYYSGYVIGLWDRVGRLETVEKVKCVRGEKDYDDRSDERDDVYYEIDWQQQVTIQLDPSNALHKPNCPDGYLLTGLTRSEITSLPSVGHCHKLRWGALHQDVCERVPPTPGIVGGGSFDPYAQWNVECRFGYAAVGLKVDEKSVKAMRCCQLTPGYPYVRTAKSMTADSALDAPGAARSSGNAVPAAADAHQPAEPAPEAADAVVAGSSAHPQPQAAQKPIYVIHTSAESREDLNSPEIKSRESHSSERLIGL